MSDAFTPQVRALLDDLEAPALSADFADRVIAQAEAAPALPPLPALRQPRLRSGRRIALAIAFTGLVGVAAAAAVVSAEVWRRVPVIGGLIELIAPAPSDPAPAPTSSEVEPIATVAPERATPAADSTPKPDVQRIAESEEATPPIEAPAVADAVPPASRPEPIERVREVPPLPVREMRVAERPTPAEARAETSAAADRPAVSVPERVRPTDVAETRQQIRERTATARQAARERQERQERQERRERRANRTN